MIQLKEPQKSIVVQHTFQKQSSIVKSFRYSFLAIFSFLITTYLFHQIVPDSIIPKNIDFIGPKYAHYQAHKNDYDTLFLGSSRVLNHINPDVVDQAAKAEGLKINSYNFGVPALREIHTYILLRDILKDAPDSLKWVFIEISLDRGYEPISNARTGRSIYWHNFSNTKIAIDYIFNSEETLLSKAALAGSHILPLIYQKFNLGAFFKKIVPVDFSDANAKEDKRLYQANDGFLGIGDNEYDETRQSFLANPSDYKKEVKSLISHHETGLKVDEPLPKNKRVLIEKILETVDAAGAVPIFIVPPTLHTADDLHQAYKESTIPTLLAYNDPSKYPQFYGIENRHDAEHLNMRTAHAFSRELAKDFAEIVKSAH